MAEERKETCSNCRFWHFAQEQPKSGFCRVNPPILAGQANVGMNLGSNLIAVWPLTLAVNWCGEWQEQSRMPPNG